MSVLHAVMHADTSDGSIHAEMKRGDRVQAQVTSMYKHANADHMVWDTSSSSENLDRIVLQIQNRLDRLSPTFEEAEEAQVKHLCWSGDTGIALPVTTQPASRKAALGSVASIAARLEASRAGSDSTVCGDSTDLTAGAGGGYEANAGQVSKLESFLAEKAKNRWRREQVRPLAADQTSASSKRPGHAGDAVTSGAEADIETLDSESGLSAPDNTHRLVRPGPGQDKSPADLRVQESLFQLQKRKKRHQMLVAVGMKEQYKANAKAGGVRSDLHTVWDSGHSGEDQSYETIEARSPASRGRDQGGIISL